MTVVAANTNLSECPACGSHKVLVVAQTATVASVYCLSCEHLFAAEVAPGQQDPPPDERPLTTPPARAETSLHCTPGS